MVLVNIFLSLENPCTFLLAKGKTWIFNTNSELSQNCTEKQIMPFKTKTNHAIQNNSKLAIYWTWCYVVIGCFDWKIGVFQQTVLRVLLYL